MVAPHDELSLAMQALALPAGFDDHEVKSISVDEIISAHDRWVEKCGGTYEIRDMDLLNSISLTPFQSAFGMDMYPTVFDKAAKYMFNLAEYQVFEDGNKRTALEVGITFLEKNGYQCELSNAEAYHITMDIATKKIAIEKVSEVLERNCVPIANEEQLTKATAAEAKAPNAKQAYFKKIYIKVPFSEKNEAKGLGARWDSKARSWYCCESNLHLFENRWPLQDFSILDEDKVEKAPEDSREMV